MKEHTFRSAPLKGGPSLISGASPDDLETYQTLVETMGTVFLDEVKATRADRLKISDELLFSGRVWTAHEALDLIGGQFAAVAFAADQFLGDHARGLLP